MKLGNMNKWNAQQGQDGGRGLPYVIRYRLGLEWVGMDLNLQISHIQIRSSRDHLFSIT